MKCIRCGHTFGGTSRFCERCIGEIPGTIWDVPSLERDDSDPVDYDDKPGYYDADACAMADAGIRGL